MILLNSLFKFNNCKFNIQNVQFSSFSMSYIATALMIRLPHVIFVSCSVEAFHLFAQQPSMTTSAIVKPPLKDTCRPDVRRQHDEV